MKRPRTVASLLVCSLAVAALVLAGRSGLFAAEPKADEAKPVAKTEAKKAEQIRLYVEGAYCPGCSSVLSEALALSGVKNNSKISPNGGKGFVIVLGDFSHKADLTSVATAINGAQTPHKKISKPGVALELFAKLDEASAAKALKTLEKVKGVDAAGSTTDTQRGVIGVRLIGGEVPISVESLIAALKKDGIEAKIETDTVVRFTESPAEEKTEEKK